MGFTTRENISNDFFGGNQHLVFQKKVVGDATMFLGQERENWRPLIHTTVNLTDISRCESQLKPFIYAAPAFQTFPWFPAASSRPFSCAPLTRKV